MDDKVPLNEEYRTDGGLTTIDRWVSKTRGYFMGKIPSLLYLLDWVERQEHMPVTSEMIEAEAVSKGLLTAAEINKVNVALWTFLQMCTFGGAATTHNLASPLNGFDSWRRILMAANRGKSLRVGQLRRAVRKPEAIGKLEHVSAGIDKFDTAIQRLVEAGGSRPTDQEMKQDLLEILPQEFRESLLWISQQGHMTYAAFREHILTKSAEVLDNRGKLGGGIHSIEDEIAKLQELVGNVEANAPAPDAVAPQGNTSVLDRLEEILAIARGNG